MVDSALNWQLDIAGPDKSWVRRITYIRTQEGFAYLAVVIDFYSGSVIGRTKQRRQTRDIALQALLMAVWRWKPGRCADRSDQGRRFTGVDWATFVLAHNLEHSMSGRGNGHDIAVAESFFSLLKRERISRQTYRMREEARQEPFDAVEMFDNQRRAHARGCRQQSSNGSR